MTDGTFPIRLDDKISSVPMALMQKHDVQAVANHGHGLVWIASRGGLTPEEAVCVLEDKPFERMGATYATLRLMELVNQHRGRPVPVLLAVPAPPIGDRLEHALGLVRRLRDGRAVPHKALYNELEVILQAAKDVCK